MKLRTLKLYALEHATLATLVLNVNAFTAGTAVGGYAAGEVKDQDLIDQRIDHNPITGVYYATMWYAEG